MNKYNTNIDSIGTEISETEYAQNGGFLASIFGFNDDNSTLISSSETKNDTVNDTEANSSSNIDLTPLIIKSIDDENYQVADYLIAQRFTPNLQYVNKKKENLINVLINARNKMTNADKALMQLIPFDVSALNKPDANGVTPFFNAVKKGYNDLANYMENFGAKRISPSKELDIVTDKENDNGTTSAFTINLDTVTENPQYNFEQSKSSIFSKPVNENTIDQKNTAISDIVKAFKTKSDNSTELANTIDIGDIGTEQHTDTYNIFDAKTKNVKSSLENLKNLINAKAKSNNIFQNPLDGIQKNVTNTDDIIDNLADRLAGAQTGGAKSNKHKDDLRKIARSVNKQKNEFHDSAVEKIYTLLPKNKQDKLTAKAVKSLIYNEIKTKNKELTGLDRASELLKAVSKDKVKEMLKNEKEIKQIIDYLSSKTNTTTESAN